MEHSKLYYEVLAECSECIKQWKEENNGTLPIEYGDYITTCWNYGGSALQSAIDALMQEECEETISPILEYELLEANVGMIQANRIRIGHRISNLRKRKGLSIRDLAEITGLDHSNIGKVERGKYNVSIDILGKITQALGVELKIE